MGCGHCGCGLLYSPLFDRVVNVGVADLKLVVLGLCTLVNRAAGERERCEDGDRDGV